MSARNLCRGIPSIQGSILFEVQEAKVPRGDDANDPEGSKTSHRNPSKDGEEEDLIQPQPSLHTTRSARAPLELSWRAAQLT